MSFSKGLKIERSQRGHVEARHSCGLHVVRSMAPHWLDNPKVSPEAFEQELDRLERAAVEALKNLYAHQFRPRKG